MTEKELLVASIQDFCRTSGMKCGSTGSGLVVELGNRSVFVDIKPVELTSLLNEDLVWEVKIFARVDTPAPRMMSPSALGVWNRYATVLSTVIVDNDLMVFSKFTIYKHSHEVVELVYARLATASIWLAFGLVCFLEDGDPSAQQFLFGSPINDLPYWLGISEDQRNQSSLISPLMFEEAASLARDRGLLAFSDSDRFSVEFPWDPEALSVLVPEDRDDNQRTSLIQIESDVLNPLYGKGVLLRIQFRLTFEDDHIAEFVNALNLWELGSVNLPPFFGSWCIDTATPSPAFVAFFPSIFSNIATPVSILSWAWGRHEAIRELMRSNYRD
jgi:hypothetical protein